MNFLKPHGTEGGFAGEATPWSFADNQNRKNKKKCFTHFTWGSFFLQVVVLLWKSKVLGRRKRLLVEGEGSPLSQVLWLVHLFLFRLKVSWGALSFTRGCLIMKMKGAGQERATLCRRRRLSTPPGTLRCSVWKFKGLRLCRHATPLSIPSSLLGALLCWSVVIMK